MYEFIKDREYFYPVTEKEISDAEKRLGFTLPVELKLFYEEMGYGFVSPVINENEHVNRILSPDSLADYFLHDGMYEYLKNDKYHSNKLGHLVFLEISSSSFISIRTDGKKGQIVYQGATIADSLQEFLENYSENDNYLHKKYMQHLRDSGDIYILEELLELRGETLSDLDE